MSIRDALLFQSDGKATATLLGQWRIRGPARPIQADAVLVEDGLATDTFRGLWRVAFPARSALPMAEIANDDGTGTDDFWGVFK